MDWGVFPACDEDQADWKIADSAIAQLERAPTDRPFFVAVGFRLPHVPCFASQKWFDLYPEKTLVLPEVREDDRDDVPAFSWFLHWNAARAPALVVEGGQPMEAAGQGLSGEHELHG